VNLDSHKNYIQEKTSFVIRKLYPPFLPALKCHTSWCGCRDDSFMVANKEYIILQIPKNASSSVSTYYDLPNGLRRTFSRVNGSLAYQRPIYDCTQQRYRPASELVPTRKAITFLRDPYKRFISNYNMFICDPRFSLFRRKAFGVDCYLNPFQFAHLIQSYSNCHWAPQSTFIDAAEELTQTTFSVYPLSQLDFILHLPHDHKKNPSASNIHLTRDEELESILRQIYKRDYELYDYAHS